MRTVHHLVQGSDEWKAHRATPDMFNGSEIAAIMGIDPKTSRSELLRMEALGYEKEFSDYVQKMVLDRGHENEALARPLAEDLIGDDLSPLVMTDTIDGLLFSVSLDGITQSKDTTQEHKSLNMMLADALDAGVLPVQYHPQCEAGLMVSGATRCLFMASKDGDVSTMRHFWYEPNMELRARMIAACKQFAIDRDAYVHVEAKAEATAAPIRDLPAIVVTVSGALVIGTNFAAWGVELDAFIARIPEKPETDQEFADCKAAVAALKKAEEQLDAEEVRVLSQVPSIDDMKREKKLLWELSRTTRLALEKLVVARDLAVKAEIIQAGTDAFKAHHAALNKRIGGFMPHINHSFSEAIKNKRSYSSMRDSVDAALANAKIAASEIADTIEANVKAVPEMWKFLFSDMAQICMKGGEDFARLAEARIKTHQVAQAASEARIAEAHAAAVAEQVAAAVEAERKAGEARAAAAIEAERIAEAKRIVEAKRIIEQEANDQRAKAEPSQDGAGEHVSPGLSASSPPDTTAPLAASDMAQSPDRFAGEFVRATLEEQRAAVVESGDTVRAYLNSLPISETERTRLRPYIMGYVQFTAGSTA